MLKLAHADGLFRVEIHDSGHLQRVQLNKGTKSVMESTSEKDK